MWSLKSIYVLLNINENSVSPLFYLKKTLTQLFWKLVRRIVPRMGAAKSSTSINRGTVRITSCLSSLALTIEYSALVFHINTRGRRTAPHHHLTIFKQSWKAPVEATRVRMVLVTVVGDGRRVRARARSSRLFFIAAVKQASLNIWLAIPRSHKRSRRDRLVRRATGPLSAYNQPHIIKT